MSGHVMAIVRHATLRLFLAAVVATPFVPASAAAAPQVPAATPELLLDQGKRLFEAFQYDQAVPLFDRLIAVLGAGGQVQRPDLLLQAYELRGRSRFALNDQAGAEQDFSALLAINPAFTLPEGVSPKVVEVFNNVRKLTIGQVVLSLVPAGDVQIDGRTVSLHAGPQTLDLTAGEHTVTAARPGHRPISQKFAVTAGESAPLALVLERVTSTLAVTSVPGDVEVILDGKSRGRTSAGSGEASEPLMLADLPNGTHRLILRKSCYRDLEHTVEITTPDDLKTEPLRLVATVANVKVEPDDPAAVVFVDGARRGTGAIDIANLCEGPHVIEVRGARGRFVDRRDWRTGDNVTLRAELRSAFPVVSTPGVPSVALDRLRTSIERALGSARGVLVYFPTDAELQNAVRGEDLPPDWLAPDQAGPASKPRMSTDIRRDIGRKLAARFEAQGVAAVAATSDPNVVTLAILAAGSGEPDVIAVNLQDPASRTRAADFLGAAFPPVLRPALDASVIDVAGVSGAVVVRVGPAGTKAGLAMGDVIVSADGAPVASVAALRKIIAAAGTRASSMTLTAKAGTSDKTIAGAVSLAPETWPPRESSLPYNRALIDLQHALKMPGSGAESTATLLNLAVVQMRLGNWEEALQALGNVKLPEGSGVSAGTVHYFVGLCQEALGRTAEARAAFTRAAASAEARLSQEGPLVAPLAQRKLRSK
jgi:tetratricopeptide (TPR) repeat protein